MQESITVIENAIQEKKEFVRRLNHEREKLIEGLSDNFSNRISTEKKIIELEKNLKELYDLTYNQEKDCKTVYDSDKVKFVPKPPEQQDILSTRTNREYLHKPSY